MFLNRKRDKRFYFFRFSKVKKVEFFFNTESTAFFHREYNDRILCLSLGGAKCNEATKQSVVFFYKFYFWLEPKVTKVQDWIYLLKISETF